MMQDEKREAIRHKTAEAITMIEEVMIIRHKLPNDRHDVNDIKNTARIIGERMVQQSGNPDFDPLTFLLAEAARWEGHSPKEQAENQIALSALAKAFGVDHQFNARQAQAIFTKAHPPQTDGRSGGQADEGRSTAR